MKIQVGVGTREDFEFFLRAGADEFYCGARDVPGHLYGGVNFGSIKEILSVARVARRHGRRFYFAVNEMQGPALARTADFVGDLCAGGLDGIIIRDLGLLSRLPAGVAKERILSSLAPCYNPEALRFYKELGITRLALPEHLLPSEAAGMVKNGLGIGTEVFVSTMEYCVVLNGICYLQQFDGQCLCRKQFARDGGRFTMARPTDGAHFGALYDFFRLGVPVLKVGRQPTRHSSRLTFEEAAILNKLLLSGLGKKEFVRLALKYHAKFKALLGRT